MFLTENADCIPANESQSQRLLREWLTLAGIDPETAFPLDREQAALVLFAGGYDVDLEKLVALGLRGQLPDLREWHGRDVLAAASCLEARRDWRPDGPQCEKLHPQMLALHELLEAGEEGRQVLRETFKRFDLKLALVLLAEAPTRELREKLLGTVHALLAVEGVML